MLTMIGQTLEENGIPNVFVKGNVYVRNRAVSAFRVCMLSRSSTSLLFMMFSLSSFCAISVHWFNWKYIGFCRHLHYVLYLLRPTSKSVVNTTQLQIMSF